MLLPDDLLFVQVIKTLFLVESVDIEEKKNRSLFDEIPQKRSLLS